MLRYYSVENPMFQRAMRNILSITQEENALVTTTFDGTNPSDHDYGTGLIIRFYIPDNFGMSQINHLKATVTVVNDTQFRVDIDTRNFDPFVVPSLLYNDDPPGINTTAAQVVPVGSINEILTMATQNVLSR